MLLEIERKTENLEETHTNTERTRETTDTKNPSSGSNQGVVRPPETYWNMTKKQLVHPLALDQPFGKVQLQFSQQKGEIIPQDQLQHVRTFSYPH